MVKGNTCLKWISKPSTNGFALNKASYLRQGRDNYFATELENKRVNGDNTLACWITLFYMSGCPQLKLHYKNPKCRFTVSLYRNSNSRRIPYLAQKAELKHLLNIFSSCMTKTHAILTTVAISNR